jgi:tRNA(Arg) A34 adenosine deaminase TadA
MSSADPILEVALARALRFARRSLTGGSFPVGAVIIRADGQVVGGGGNRTQTTGLPIDHAEMVAIRRSRAALMAAKPGELTLVTTGEPCLMCLGAILQTPSIRRIVWAIGPVSPAGSAMAAVQTAGYNATRLAGLTVVPEPSARARSASARLLYRWCVERGDPRAAMFADAAATVADAAAKGPDPAGTGAGARPAVDSGLSRGGEE